MGEQLPLCELEAGERGRIVQVKGASGFKKRLLEMGLVRGEEIEKLKVAPLADPAEYVVKGYHVSLRREEACDVVIERL